MLDFGNGTTRKMVAYDDGNSFQFFRLIRATVQGYLFRHT